MRRIISDDIELDERLKELETWFASCGYNPHKKISDILPLYSRIIVVLSNKQWELVFFSG